MSSGLIPLNETLRARRTPPARAQPMGARGGESLREGREEGPGEGELQAKGGGGGLAGEGARAERGGDRGREETLSNV